MKTCEAAAFYKSKGLSVVEQMEKIVRVVTTPPLVMQTIANRSVFIADGQVATNRVLVEMSKNGFSNVPIYLGDTLVGVMNRKMVDAVLLSKEKNRFLKAIYSYTGFKTKWLEFENIERFAGKTKWSNWQLYRYAITCIFGFSNFPVLIINFIGMLLLLISIIMIIIYAFLNKFLTTLYLFLTAMAFFTGLNIFCMSIFWKNNLL